MTTWTEEQYLEWQRRQRRPLNAPAPVPAAVKAPVAPYKAPGDDQGPEAGQGPGEDLELTPPDPKPARRVNQQEWREQCAYFRRVDQAVEDGWPGADMIYAIPNSNVAGRAVGGKLKAAGLRKGYPDINIDVPRAGPLESWPGARIEFKRASGDLSDVSKDQREWLDRLRAQGYNAVVCFGDHEAWAFTKRYLGWSE